MTKEELNTRLREAGLKKKDFCAHFNLSYSTVNNWGASRKVPYWVQSWFECYIKAKRFDALMQMAKENNP